MDLIKPLLMFSSRLFNAARNETKNTIMSPLSIHQAFSMLEMGAKRGTRTQEEILHVLGYAKNNTEKFHKAYTKLNKAFKNVGADFGPGLGPRRGRGYSETISSARMPVIDTWNKIVAKAELDQEFQHRLRDYYNSSADSLIGSDGQVDRIVDNVNKWGKKAGFEQELMNKGELMDPELIMMLMSAIRVESNWLEDDKFREYRGENFFYNHDNPKEAVKEMTLVSARVSSSAHIKIQPMSPKRGGLTHPTTEPDHERHLEAVSQFGDLTFEVGKLRLAGGIDFVIFHPEHGKLSAMCRALDERGLHDSSKLMNLLEALDSGRADKGMRAEFPKFRIDLDTKLNEVMKSLGIKRAFERNAEFDLMLKEARREFFISEAKHQAFIQVDKNGIKAAALTRILGCGSGRQPEVVPFKVRNPFMFLLRYKQFPLFIGQFVEAKE